MSESTTSKVLRIGSALAMTFVALVFGALDVHLTKNILICSDKIGAAGEHAQAVVPIAIFTLLSVVPAYMAVKFWRGAASSNGRTMLSGNFFIGLGILLIGLNIENAFTSPKSLLNLLGATLPATIVLILIGLKLRKGKTSPAGDKILKEF
jgi:hypothetical protein